MLPCPKCGSQPLPGSSFCWRCGNRLVKEVSAVQNTNPTAVRAQLFTTRAEELQWFTARAAGTPVCPHCHGPADLKSQYCVLCGARLACAAPSETPLTRPAAVHAATSPRPVARPKHMLIAASLLTGLLVSAGGVLGWYVWHRNAQSAALGKATAPTPDAPAPSPEISIPAPTPETDSAPADAQEGWPGAPVRTRRPAVRKPAAATTPTSADPAFARKATEIATLQNLARDAYLKENFVEPVGANALAYANHVLELEPTNTAALAIRENSIARAKGQTQQAILRKDFPAAQRTLVAMAQLLPGDSGVADLNSQLLNAQKAEEEARRASQAAPPSLEFRVYHLHSGKDLSQKGTYCRGLLSVVGSQIRYAGQTALDGDVHTLNVACSDVHEVKKNSRFASHDNAFHVRTESATLNFVPEDFSPAHLSALATACGR